MSLAFMPKRSERQLMIAIIRMLCYFPETFAYETDTKGTYIGKRNGVDRFISSLSRGKADIAGVKAGKAFAFEVKLPGQKLKPHQAVWAESYARGGGAYAVVHSVEEAQEAWRKI